MARQILTIAGAVVGGIVGGPVGASIGASIGGFIGGVVDPLVIQGNKIGDNPGQTASEGGTRAIVYGRGCIQATCIIARGDRKVRKKKQGGGKGGGAKTENEYVYWTFAIGLGEDLTGGSILRIWQDETLVYDVRPGGQMSPLDNLQFSRKFRFYDGNESQLPDPDLQSFLGADTPYFRGTAYIVFPQFDLTTTAERIPQFRFEVSKQRVVAPNVALYFAIDLSGSMSTVTSNGSTRLANMQTALNTTLDYVKVNLVDVGFEVDIMLSGFTTGGSIVRRNCSASDLEDLKAWVSGRSAAGGTDFAIGTQGMPAFYAGASSSSARIAFFITDGEPDSPAETTAADARAYVDQVEGLSCYGINIDLSNTTYTAMVQNVAGKSVPVVEGGDPSALVAVMAPLLFSGSESVNGIVAALMQRAGYSVDQFDVSELGDAFVGVTFEQSMTGQEAVAATLTPYFADPIEHTGEIRFVKRGKSVVKTVTDEDLLEEPETQQRENVIEYPRKLHFFYQSPATGYATTKATSSRSSPNAAVTGEASVSAPITFDDASEPAQISAKWHKVMWTEAQGEIVWKVADSHLDLVPGDCVGLALRGNVRRARITKTEFEPGSITLTMREDRQSAYTSSITGIPLPSPVPPQPTTMAKTVLLVLDIPALLDSDDELIYYTAMSGMTEIWTGAQLQRSLDDGASYSAISDETTNAIIGTLQAAIGASTQDTIDDASVVRIQLYDPNDEIDAISDAEFEAEGGAFALETATGWEVMQFRDAEDLGGGLYELSHLMRGRLNTSPDAHTVGQRFVLLDASIRKYSAQSSWIGTTLKHRGVSYGTSPEDADIVTTTFTGASQREWSVAGFSATYDGAWVSVTDIVPRHRFGTYEAPIPSVNWTGYRITASDGTNSVSVDTTNTSLLLDASSIGTVTSVKVEQLNRITGPGQPATVAPTTVPAGTNAPTAVVNAGGAP